MVPIVYQHMINQETGRTEVRMVDRNSYRYSIAYKFVTRLKLEHADDNLLFEKLSELTQLPVREFN